MCLINVYQKRYENKYENVSGQLFKELYVYNVKVCTVTGYEM
jgi:hypothetical protein